MRPSSAAPRAGADGSFTRVTFEPSTRITVLGMGGRGGRAQQRDARGGGRQGALEGLHLPPPTHAIGISCVLQAFCR